MRFPNAAAGVKKIFTAEILALIAAIATLISTILLVVTLGAAASGSKGGTIVAGGFTAILFVAAGIVGIVAFIMSIVGISNASKDEPTFKTALICVIVGIIGSLVASIFSGNAVVSAIGSLVTNVANLFVTIFVITGIIRLADQLNNAEVGNKGNNILKMIIAISVLAIIANLIVLIMGGRISVVAGIIAIVAAVLEIVQYIMYLSFLSNAKAMLAE